MGWITFTMNFGLRFENPYTTEEELIEAVQKAVDSSPLNYEGMILSRLDQMFKNTERGGLGEWDNRYEEEDYIETFGENPVNHYLLYFKSITLDTSNGTTLDTNRVYSGGHMEFYNGTYDDLDTKEEHLKNIADSTLLDFEMAWSLRSRGSWAKTQAKSW